MNINECQRCLESAMINLEQARRAMGFTIGVAVPESEKLTEQTVNVQALIGAAYTDARIARKLLEAA